MTSRAGSLALVGGAAAFDFTNTSSGRGGPRCLEHLQTGGDVLLWARHARVLTPEQGDHLDRLAADPAFARQLLDRALGLRETIHRIGVAAANPDQTGRHQWPMADLAALAAAHAHALARARLIPGEPGLAWHWDVEAAPLAALCGPILLSAIGLLTSPDLRRIRQCQGEHCGWLFLDTTKNRSRRWCEMEVCGNRAKQRRHQDARRAAQGRRYENT
jgi:predicted RNA-binding Zn ribbon-like protein